MNRRIEFWVCPICRVSIGARGPFDHGKCMNCNVWIDATGSALWTTEDKQRIPIWRMETSHINNCIAMILVRPEWRPGFAKLLIEELEKRRRKEVPDEQGT